jgi:hypothetical protein
MNTFQRNRGRNQQVTRQAGLAGGRCRGLRPALVLESLESRTLLSVTANVNAQNVLDINLSAANDTAVVSFDGSNLDVTGDSTSLGSFLVSSLTGIDVTGSGSSDQSVTFQNASGVTGAVSLSGALTTSSITTLTISDTYDGQSASLAADSITIDGGGIRAPLAPSGDSTDLSLLAGDSESGTTTDGGVTTNGNANAGVTLTGATLQGDDVSISASATMDVTNGGNVVAGAAGGNLVTVDVGSSAQIEIEGSTTIKGAGSVMIGSTSTAIVTANPEANALESTGVDAAIADLTVTTNATAEISGSTAITAGGAFMLTATNTTNAVTSADGSAAGSSAGGATVAVGVVNSTTQADITGAATVSAKDVTVSATSTATADSSAQSTAQGATRNDSSTSDVLSQYNAKTSDGAVGVVGAVAVTDLTQPTSAYINSSGLIKGSSSITVDSSSTTDDSTTADGSDTTGKVGVGVAVAINLANVTNTATIQGGADDSAPTISVGAMTPPPPADTTNPFSASATSGAGGSKVGVAGSVAINLVTDTSSAEVEPNGTATAVTFGNGDSISLSAQNLADESASALPSSSQGASGSSVGVGASAALAIASNSASAELASGMQVSGAPKLSLSATSTDTAATTATTGASGGTGVAAAVAISLVTNTTTAEVGSSDTTGTGELKLGSLSASATHTGTTTSTAGGTTAGTSAGIGASIAVNLATDQTTAMTSSNLNSSGAVSFTATGSGTSTATATASASGGPTDNGSADGSGGGTENGQTVGDVDDQDGDQRSFADSEGTSAGISDDDASTPSAETSDDQDDGKDAKVSVAAAIAVNIADSEADATIPDGLSVTSGGALTVSASNTTSATATADGTSSGTAKVGVGAAVAINLAKADSEGRIGAGTTITAQSVSVQGQMNGGPNAFAANATAGAGSSKVGVAGAVGINLATASGIATIGDSTVSSSVTPGAKVKITTGGTGAVSLTAEDDSGSTATALPATDDGADGDSVGIGASVGLNIVTNTTSAELADNVSLSGANALTLSATSTDTMTTTATTGATSTGGVAIAAAVSISLADNTTTAQLGSNDTTSGQTELTVGSLSATATHTGSTTSSAGGTAAGKSATIGAAIDLHIATDKTTATTNSSLDATAGPVSFTATATGTSTSGATASAVGAQPDDGGSDDKSQDGTSVESQDDSQRSYADSEGDAAGVGDSSGDASNPSPSTSGGGVSVAAAIGVNIVDNEADATIPNGLTVSSGGALSVSASNTSTATATSDGSAAGGSKVGIGAAVSLNVVTATALATIGTNATISAVGVNVTAGMTGTGTPVNDFEASATSGAAGTSVGVAGSLAINIVTDRSEALIETGASVNAGGGDVGLSSLNNSTDTASAMPSAGGATGGSVGIGASLGLNIITDTTESEVENGAALVDAGSVNLTANSPHTITTTAENGAAGATAVGAGVAIAIASDTTTASIGTDASTLNATGGLTISATGSFTLSNTADAAVKAQGNVGIGATIALNVAQDSFSAKLERSVQAGGAISITASPTSSGSATATASEQGAPPSGQGGQTADSDSSGQFSFAQFEGGTDFPKMSAPPAMNTVMNGQSDSSSSQASSPSGQAGSQSGGSSGETSAGIAAAVAVNVLTSSAVAEIVSSAADPVSVTTTGSLTVGTTNQSSATALGDGTAVKNKTSIGAAAALNVATVTNDAEIDPNASISAAGVTITADMSSGAVNDFSAVGLGVAVGAQNGIAGSVGINVITVNTQASVGTGSSVTSFGGLTVGAANDETLQNIALTAASGGNVGAGAAVAVNVVNNSTLAYLDSSVAANVAGSTSVTAESSFNPSADDIPMQPSLYGITVSLASLHPTALAAGVGASSGDAGVAGSFIVNVINQTTEAYLGTDDLINTLNGTSGYPAADQGVTVSAGETMTTVDWVGAAGGGDDFGAGAALEVDIVTENTQGYIAAHAVVDSTRDVVVTSTSSGTFQPIAAAAAAGGSGGIAGAVDVEVVLPTTKAYVEPAATVSAAGDLLVQASRTTTIDTLAGGLAGGGDAGVGASVSTVVDTETTEAYIGNNDNITVSGIGEGLEILTGAAPGATTPFAGVGVAAASFQNLQTIAVGGAVGGNFGVAGSAAINVLNETTLASVGAGATVNATDNAPGNGPSLIVRAADPLSVFSTGGAVAIGGDAGIGAGVDIGSITKNTQADILTATVTADGDVQVQALSSEQIGSITGAVAGSSSVAVAGSAGIYVLSITTRAFIGPDNDTTNAFGDPTTGSTSVHASGSILVAAAETTTLNLLSGGAAVSGDASVGASAGVPIITKTTEAFIGTGAKVGALGLGDPLDADNGQFAISYVPYGTTPGTDQEEPPTEHANLTSSSNSNNNDLTSQRLTEQRVAAPETQLVNGLAVTAINSDDLQGVGVDAGVSGSVAANLSGSVAVLTNNTDAYIGNGAAINANNAGAQPNQSVLVAAGNDASFLGIAAALSISGTASVSPGVVVVVINNTTTASINDSASVQAVGDVDVVAHSSGDVLTIAAAGAISGTASVGGSVSFVDLSDTTDAYIGDSGAARTTGPQVSAGGNVLVDASDDTEAYLITGVVAVGGDAGMGGSVGVADLTKNTDASIGNYAKVSALGNSPSLAGVYDGNYTQSGGFETLASFHGVAVQAASSENVTNVAAVGAAGLYAGLAGGVSIELFNSDTKAYIGADSNVNTNPTGASAAQAVDVAAVNQATDFSFAGGIAGGAAGIAGGVDVGMLENSTQAYIAGGATVLAQQDVNVYALSNDSVTSYGLGAAGGVFAGAASVSVWSIGALYGATYGDGNSSDGTSDSVSDSDLESTTSNAEGNTGGASSFLGSLTNSSNNGATGNTQDISTTVGSAQTGLGSSITPNQTYEAIQSTTVPAGTVAFIGTSAFVTAGGNVNVCAQSQINDTVYTGGLAAGAVGIGASIAIVNVHQHTQAYIDTGSSVSAGGTIAVSAILAGDTVSGTAFAGLAGATAALGAQVVDIQDSSTESAAIDNGASIPQAQSVQVTASSKRTLDPEAIGGSVAGLGFAVGVGVAIAQASGGPAASIGNDVLIGPAAPGQGDNVGSVTVTATASDTIDAQAIGVSAGVGPALNGVYAGALSDPAVSATIGSSSVIQVTGGITVNSSMTPDLSAAATGVSVSGDAALGVSLSSAQSDPEVTAKVGNDTQFGESSPASLDVAALVAQDAADDPTASAEASAGTGGVLAGINATDAEASSDGQVTASTGDQVSLPGGAVTVSASNQTYQVATATGVVIGGGLAAGGDVGEATSDVSTSATLGTDSTSSARTGALTVMATGQDENQTNVTAGSGGGIALDAAAGTTNDQSQVSANLEGGTLNAGLVTVGASNSSVYSPNINSLSVGVGAVSGAIATNTNTTSAKVTIGTTGETTEINTPDPVLIDSQNGFSEDSSAQGVQGGSGGVGSGAAGLSQSTIKGTSSVTLAQGVTINSGTDPVNDPGGIALLASSQLTTFDQVSLNSAGGVSGSGADSSLTATLNNSVTIGSGDQLTSQGDIEAATYTIVTAQTNATTDTYGAAAGTGASATTSVTTNQTVTVDSGATLLAIGLVELTPGTDTLDGFDTTLTALATADSLAEAVIGVAYASATADLTSNATLNIDAGATIDSGQNVTIGGYPGTLTPAPSSDATNSVAGIPIATTGTNSQESKPTSSVTQDGTIVAGYYHELSINIPASGNQFTVNGGQLTAIPANDNPVNIDSPTGALNPFVAFTAQYDDSFSPPDFIQQNFSGSTVGDVPTAQFLDETTSSDPVDAMEFGPLYASGGDVVVNADTLLTGNGSVTANVAQINITNSSPDYLVLNSVTIPDLPGGVVDFTGTLTSAPGMTVNQAPSAQIPSTPSITIDNSYNSAVGNTQYGPAIFLVGAVSNLSGSLTITNIKGSLGEAAGLDAYSLSLNVYGSYVVTATGQLASVGSDPFSVWQNYMVWPGGNPTLAGFDAPDQNGVVVSAQNAAVYAANAQFAATFGATFPDNPVGFTQGLISQAGALPPLANYSFIYFGSELPWVTGNSAYDNSTYDDAIALYEEMGFPSIPQEAYQISPSNTGQNGEGWFPVVPTVSLVDISPQGNCLTCSGFLGLPAPVVTPAPNPPIEVASGLVSIVAGTIDLDAQITAGQSNDYSLSLPATLNTQIDTFKQNWQDVYPPDPTLALALPPVSAGETAISATYDVLTDQITVADVFSNTSSPYVFLDGDIINTNPPGVSGDVPTNINVISGVSNVSIDNETGIPVLIDDVDTGTNAASLVDIINTDPNFPKSPDGQLDNQTLYVYTPGGGTVTYTGPQSAVPSTRSGFALASTSAGGSASYSPVAGDRWQFELEANLTRTDWSAPLADNETQDPLLGNWTWVATPGSQVPYWQFIAPDGSLQSSATGEVINDATDENNVFVEKIGSPAMQFLTPPPSAPNDPSDENLYFDISGADNEYIYHEDGHYGFAPAPAPADQSIDPWFYIYPLYLTLNVSASMKADYPIGINFSGSSTGELSITSNATVFLNGSIINPDGTTSIDVTNGGIIEAAPESLSSGNLTLIASGTVGERGRPITASMTGVLNAASGPAPDGLYINLTSSAVIGTISSGDVADGFGDVDLSATGSLTPLLVAGLLDSSDITGDNITLDSSGEIGDAVYPLILNAQPTTLPGGGTTGGVVNITAIDLVNVEQAEGNLLVGLITTGGDVEVSAPEGQILDARAEEAGQALDGTQVQQIEAALDLNDLGAVNQRNAYGFAEEVEDEYRKYWTLLGVGAVTNGVYSLNSTGIGLYNAQVKAALDSSTVTAAQEQTYANDLYQQLVSFFNQTYGANWSSLLEFQTYVPDYKYTLTQAQVTALTDPGWTTAELEDTLDSVALEPSSGPEVGNGKPDIVGDDVTLSAGGGVGRLAPAVIISAAELLGGNLSPPQISALATATSRGDITLQNAAGVTIPFSTSSTLPAGWPVGYQFTITETEPFFVSASGSLNATVGGSLIVQGTGLVKTAGASLRVGDVVVADNAVLAAPGSIIAASTGSPGIQVSGNLTLTATGAIGSGSTGPLPIAVGGTVSATAGLSINLYQTGGALVISQAVAKDNVSLKADDAINDPTSATITGTSVTLLSTTQGIGASGAPVAVSTAADGSLTAQAVGDVFITDNTKGTALTVASLSSSTGNVTLSTGGNATLKRVSAPAGTANVTAFDSILNGNTGTTSDVTATSAVLNASTGTIGTSTDPLEALITTLSANAKGGAWIDQPTGNLELDNVVSGASVSFVVGGSILAGSNAPQTQVKAQSIALTSRTGSIGSAAGDLVIETGYSGAGSLTASAATGINISQTEGVLNVSSATTSKGDMTFDVPGDSSHNDNLTLQTGGSLRAPAGTIFLNVGGNVTVPAGSVVSAKSDVIVTGDFDNESSRTGGVISVDAGIASPNVVITGGRQGEVVNLQAAAASSSVDINLSAGTNTINIGGKEPSTGGVLSTIKGSVNVTGNGSDILNIDDSGSTVTQTGTLTGTALTGLGMGASGITYSGMVALNISLGTGDTLNVQSEATGTTTTITGGTVDSAAVTGSVNTASSGGSAEAQTGAMVLGAPSQAGTGRPGGNSKASIVLSGKAPALRVSYNSASAKPGAMAVDSIFQDSGEALSLASSHEGDGDLDDVARMLARGE